MGKHRWFDRPGVFCSHGRMATTAAQTSILLEVGTNEVEIFEFTLEGQSFGINVAKVQQILRRDSVKTTRLDFSPPSVVGSILFRGKPVLLIDLKQKLSIESKSQDSGRQLILVTEFNQITSAFVVDGAQRIHRVSWKQIEPMQEVLAFGATYATGVVRLDDRIMIIIDFEHILAEINPASSPHAGTEKVASGGTNDARKKTKILFAEDSGMIRKLTMDQLRMAGFENVVPVEDGMRALRWIEQKKAAAEKSGGTIHDYLDLVLTDIEMPEMDGLTLCKKIKVDLGLSSIPVVVYSSLINEQMIRKCKQVGADNYMSKPQVDKIIEIIDQTKAAQKVA